MRAKLIWCVVASIAASTAASAAEGPRRLSLPAATPKLTPEATLAEWQRQRFGVLTTELSPAVLVLCRTKGVRFFAELSRWGLGAPRFVGVPTKGGVRVVRRGSAVPAAMSEAWLLCWFNGAEGWSQWDAPILLVLQHKPVSIALGDDGLSLRFPKEAGLVAVMPLYGTFKVPLSRETDFLARHGLPSRGIHTDAWARGLPAAVQQRCRTFARMLRMVPVHCREEFAIEGADVAIRMRFAWLPIADDWGTAPRKFAPLPPTLAIVHATTPHPPLTLSAQATDAKLFTPYGPLYGVLDADGYTIRMPVMKYVAFAEEPQRPDTARHPAAAVALSKLQSRLARKFRTSDWQQIWDHGGAGNYCWQVMGDRWYAKAIPYLEPAVQTRVKTALAAYLDQFILQEKHYKPFRGMLMLRGPGIGQWGGYDDAGKFSSNLLETVWNIAHYADAWDVVKARWPMIKRLFVTPLEADWKSFGRYAIAEMGDEAAPPLALARLAYRVGDHETFAFASYIFARELVHHCAKQTGASYFRAHQPWVSMEPMPEEVYLTNMWGDLAGWRIDGPSYPRKTGERQFSNRWVRFSCEEVAWFYRDVLADQVRAELELLTERARRNPKATYKLGRDTAHIAASLVRLRALLLRETPAQLARLAPPETWGARAGDLAAMCVPCLRNASPIKRERLIPAVKTPFVLGLARARARTNHPTMVLVCDVPDPKKAPDWARGHPLVRWWGWPPPKPVRSFPAGRWWSFGLIVPSDYAPTKAESRWLNWNTRAWSLSP